MIQDKIRVLSYMDAIKQSDKIAVGQKQQKILKDFYEFIQLYKTRSKTESGSDIIKDLFTHFYTCIKYNHW